MNITPRMPLAALALAAAVGISALAIAHEPGKKKPEAQAHPMTDMQHSMQGMQQPMRGMEQSMAGMSEGSRELHQAMMSGMKMPMKMTGNVDTDFATMMTMHHQQAIQMSDVLLKYGKQPELRALAQKMKADQLEEIRKMAPYRAPTKK